jgi:hypothetical protein
MNRKKEIPQETEMEQPVPQDKESEDVDTLNEIIDNWEELQRVLDGASTDELFEKGWRPLLKSKSNGKQYITLRLHGRDPETGKQIDTERGLGVFHPENSERWDALLALYEISKPPLPSVAARYNPQPLPASQVNRSSILTTKVTRIAPIGPSVQIKLGTLQWYTWVQSSAGYPGTLDDFINQSVDTLFRDHYKLELAVVNQKEEKN